MKTSCRLPRKRVARAPRRLAIAMCLAMCAPLAQADVINIDFNAQGSPTFNGRGAFLDLDGNSETSAVRGFWNGITVPVQGSDARGSGGLLMSDGATSTGVTVTFSNYSQTIDLPDSPIPPSEARALMQDGALSSGPITISGLLPDTSYLVVLYGRSPNPQRPVGTNFTFGSRVGGAFVSTFLAFDGSDAQPGAVRLTSARDYAMVNAKTDAVGRLNLLHFVGALNGMQIVGDFDTQTLFTTQAPANPAGFDDGVPYELGTRIKPTSNGIITSLRFWRPASLPANETPTGKLYASDGTVLAQVEFPGIAFGPASGWQQAELPTPVQVGAGSEYVVSVSTSGYYAFSFQGAATTLGSGSLVTAGPGSGVFGPLGSIPTTSWNNSHYFRDVVFVPTR
jgi:Domain of unknown function (DUF4082)